MHAIAGSCRKFGVLKPSPPPPPPPRGPHTGQGVLENVRIRGEAFEYLKLPVAIAEGSVGKLRIQARTLPIARFARAHVHAASVHACMHVQCAAPCWRPGSPTHMPNLALHLRLPAYLLRAGKQPVHVALQPCITTRACGA